MLKKSASIDGVYTKMYRDRYKVLKHDVLNRDEEFDRIRTDLERISEHQVLKELNDIEELYLQKRTILNMDDIKLGIQGSLVFARTAFIRSDKDSQHLRVYIGKTSYLGEDLESLYNNEEFMFDAKRKLHREMCSIFEQTKARMQQVYQY